MAFNQSLSIAGPSQSCSAGGTGSGNETISIPATGDYTISWQCTAPLVRDGSAASGLVVRIRNNTQSSNIFLGSAGVCQGGQVWFSATAADVISINLSSTVSADYNPINAVKGTFALSSGV